MLYWKGFYLVYHPQNFQHKNLLHKTPNMSSQCITGKIDLNNNYNNNNNNGGIKLNFWPIFRFLWLVELKNIKRFILDIVIINKSVIIFLEIY